MTKNYKNPDLATRIAELRQLKDGWLDGHGKALSQDQWDWFESSMKKHYPEFLPSPHLFPTEEGGLSLEWHFEGCQCIEAKIFLPSMEAYVNGMWVGERTYWDYTLDLTKEDEWQSLVDHINFLFTTDPETGLPKRLKNGEILKMWRGLNPELLLWPKYASLANHLSLEKFKPCVGALNGYSNVMWWETKMLESLRPEDASSLELALKYTRYVERTLTDKNIEKIATMLEISSHDLLNGMLWDNFYRIYNDFSDASRYCADYMVFDSLETPESLRLRNMPKTLPELLSFQHFRDEINGGFRDSEGTVVPEKE